MALPATQSTWAAVIFTLGKDARGEIHCRPGRWGLLAGRIRPVLWVIPGIIREVQSKMGTEAKLASGSLAEPPGSIESNRSAYDLGAWERWRPGWLGAWTDVQRCASSLALQTRNLVVPPAEATCVYLRAGVILNCLTKRCRCSRGEIWRDMARPSNLSSRCVAGAWPTGRRAEPWWQLGAEIRMAR